ncbi:hypothetical protein RRG08_046822 [Elysia crispata]|uniref:Uncharacterized protein n=1 Tax=Elysia crispata TaxID=231223 RepID=A0AAE0ZNS9_9GAST|nr:hypothetical protein RRG08_046822 [Elysia crispata]
MDTGDHSIQSACQPEAPDLASSMQGKCPRMFGIMSGLLGPGENSPECCPTEGNQDKTGHQKHDQLDRVASTFTSDSSSLAFKKKQQNTHTYTSRHTN